VRLSREEHLKMTNTNASNRPRSGIALGGGGARGYAHIGVMRVLEREGLRPDVIAGTSMGGLIGAFFAAGLSADTVERIVNDVELYRLLDINPLKDLLRFTELEAILSRHLPKRFEDLERPLCVTATDLVRGKQSYLFEGDLFEALRCTIAFPGAIDPVWVGDQLLADGGILNQVPVDAARFLGAVNIVAVDATALAQLEVSPNREQHAWWQHWLGRDRDMNGLRAVYRAVEIMQSRISDVRLALFKPDLMLEPDMPDITLFGFNKASEAVAAGETVVRAHLEELRGLLSADVTE
jgi:NTE family protein